MKLKQILKEYTTSKYQKSDDQKKVIRDAIRSLEYVENNYDEFEFFDYNRISVIIDDLQDMLNNAKKVKP